MRLPNPLITLTWLPASWVWVDRVDRWRWEPGILTGRWTQAEIDDIGRRAHAQYLELQEHIE